MKIPFKYYLHDDYTTSERLETILGQLPASTFKDFTEEEDEALYERVRTQGNPFYEVTLECILDTDTGEVILVSAKL